MRVAHIVANTVFPKLKKDKDVVSVIGVDLGVNTDAVYAAVQEDGTVTEQRFINSPVEKDRMYGLFNTIRKAQQNGGYKTPRLWKLVNYYNRAASMHTATEIIRFAKKCGASIIIFELLDIKGKKNIVRRSSECQFLYSAILEYNAFDMAFDSVFLDLF